MDAVFPFSFAFVADYSTLVRVLSASFNMFQSEERYVNEKINGSVKQEAIPYKSN